MTTSQIVESYDQFQSSDAMSDVDLNMKDQERAQTGGPLSDTKSGSVDVGDSIREQHTPKESRSSISTLDHVWRDVVSKDIFVYRAVRQERLVLGLNQAPCIQCPAFKFCNTKGPVNPQGCMYYGPWLAREVVRA